MFNDEFLQAFINRFYGYGNYRARYWFVGMEEGGGKRPKEIAKRIEVWHRRGRKELEDVAEYHREIHMPRFFSIQPRIQPTWSKLIRVLLKAEGRKCGTEQVREYQKTSLGRKAGESCLLELLPLPSPNASTWQYYRKHSSLPFLKNRSTYTDHVIKQRIEHLRSRIANHKPQVVVFYGLRYQRHWEVIAAVEFQEGEPEGVRYGSDGKTLFVITRHSTARGVTNEYFDNIGGQIAGRLSTLAL